MEEKYKNYKFVMLPQDIETKIVFILQECQDLEANIRKLGKLAGIKGITTNRPKISRINVNLHKKKIYDFENYKIVAQVMRDRNFIVHNSLVSLRENYDSTKERILNSYFKLLEALDYVNAKITELQTGDIFNQIK